MSKHVKALRAHASGTAVTMFPRGDLLDAADHMEKLERQLRIARGHLREEAQRVPHRGIESKASRTLAAMRRAGRKK